MRKLSERLGVSEEILTGELLEFISRFGLLPKWQDPRRVFNFIKAQGYEQQLLSRLAALAEWEQLEKRFETKE